MDSMKLTIGCFPEAIAAGRSQPQIRRAGSRPECANRLRAALEKHRDELRLTAMKALLTELEVRSKEMPNLEIDPLKERAAAAETQLSVSSMQVSEVESALQKATLPGLDSAECVLPDGARILDRAKHWKAKLEAGPNTISCTSLSRQRCCSTGSTSRRCRHTSNCATFSASATMRLRH